MDSQEVVIVIVLDPRQAPTVSEETTPPPEPREQLSPKAQAIYDRAMEGK